MHSPEELSLPIHPWFLDSIFKNPGSLVQWLPSPTSFCTAVMPLCFC